MGIFLRGVKMIKILAWLLLILFSPLIIIIGSLVGVFMLIHAIFCEMERIFDYQIIPYIKWKIKIVREIFRKKDSN
jgi:uncharacterized membrane protein